LLIPCRGQWQNNGYAIHIERESRFARGVYISAQSPARPPTVHAAEQLDGNDWLTERVLQVA
jgi:hypothetical protein